MYKPKTIQLKKTDFQVLDGVIWYKKRVPMWNCASETLDNYSFHILDESEEATRIVTICCMSDDGNLYSYGSFRTAAEAQAWAESPYPLY